MATTALPDRRRLLIFAVALPAVVVAIDHLTWMRSGVIGGRAFFLSWLVCKSGLLAWTAGRAFGCTPWGWGVFVWSMALIDIHAFGASFGVGADLDQQTFALVSAQLGLLIVWFLLGTSSIAWRLTAAILGAAAVIYFVQCVFLWENWSDSALVAVQAGSATVLAVVAIALRMAGFRLRSIEPASGASGDQQSVQFGVKHMLVWTTAIVPLVMVSKGIDVAGLSRFTSFEVFPAALIGGCIVLVTLSAVWATLGKGVPLVRWSVLATAAVGAGATLQNKSLEWEQLYGRWPSMDLIRMAVSMGRDLLWFTWFALTAALLAAMLLFLRGCGFRLAKLAVRSDL